MSFREDASSHHIICMYAKLYSNDFDIGTQVIAMLAVILAPVPYMRYAACVRPVNKIQGLLVSFCSPLFVLLAGLCMPFGNERRGG